MAIVNVTGISGINSITAQSTSLNFYDSAGSNLPISAATLNVGTGASVSSPATNVLTLGTNNVERVRINSTGVGIGTNNPLKRLDVRGDIYIDRNNTGLTELTKTFETPHAVGNRGSSIRMGLNDGSFGGIEVENVLGSNSSYNSQTVHIVNHNGGVAGDIRSLTARFNGNVGIASTIPAYALDVVGDIRASSSFILPNNYALVAYSEGSTTTARSTTSTSYADDPDNASVRASFSYKRGDIIIFEAFIPGGIALATSGTNYTGVKFVLRATDGTATADSNDTQVWYRDDGTAIKETMQLATCTYIIDASSTTFANNSTVYAYIRFAQVTGGTGSFTTGMSNWSGRRYVRGYQFRKVA